VPFFLDIGTSELFDLNGNAGDDSVDVGNGVGAVLATDVELGEGNDAIRARNDSAQKIDGGNGLDTAQVDATDQVINVETVDAPDTAAPKVAIVSKSLKVRNGKAAVRVRCPAGETSCTGRIRILRRGKVVGARRVALDGAQAKTVRVALNRKTRVALAKDDDKRLRVTVRIRVEDAAGNTGRVSKRINLRG
jgi:hypothetical protein